MRQFARRYECHSLRLWQFLILMRHFVLAVQSIKQNGSSKSVFIYTSTLRMYLNLLKNNRIGNYKRILWKSAALCYNTIVVSSVNITHIHT
jgi:hypothetical protein